MKNIIFDIQRFCVNDGPGIRTTVFLKGCMLNCLWCHNPESKINKPTLMLHFEKCISCMKCMKKCGLHTFDVEGGHLIDRNNCNLCGECVKECSGALEVCGMEKSAEEVIKIVLKDKDFYINSSGGMTISGGDPLANIGFTKELLIEAKKHGIHTAIETCGYRKWEDILEIIPYIDLFLWDIKEVNPVLHKQFTGVDNELIFDNLNKLNELDKPIILRCPIIPSLNNRDDHFKFIGQLASKLKNVIQVDIEPYNPLGKVKYEEIGIEYSLVDLKRPSDEEVEKWIKSIKKYTNKKILKA